MASKLRACGAFLIIALVTAAPGVLRAQESAYPADWPPLAPHASDCPDLSGQFRNADRGIEFPRHLASWVHPRTETPYAFIRSLQFQGPVDGVISITIRDKQDAVAGVRQWRQGKDYKCERGWLVLPQPAFRYPGFLVEVTARLSRSVDGNLVIEHIEVGGSTALLAPGPKRMRLWHLYESAGAVPQR